jgi:predicted DNA-binding protein (MmcQ/YjbR family)
MNVEELREYCISKKGVTESFPFDEVTLVFKAMNKMFALLSLDGDLSINLKCDPEKAIQLREEFPAVQPGYHMNKKHWNTVNVDASISDQQIKQWIDDSYMLIIKSLPKKVQQEWELMK